MQEVKSYPLKFVVFEMDPSSSGCGEGVFSGWDKFKVKVPLLLWFLVPSRAKKWKMMHSRDSSCDCSRGVADKTFPLLLNIIKWNNKQRGGVQRSTKDDLLVVKYNNSRQSDCDTIK